VWAARRARAALLIRESPHAEEILVFYIRLNEAQERVAERVPADAWGRLARTVQAGPGLQLDKLPREELLPLFDDFLRETAVFGTDVIEARARELLEAEPDQRRAGLAQPIGFHVRAFLEPVLTTLSAEMNGGPKTAAARVCFRCGSPPVVGVLQDLPEALGARSLVCPLCATEWRVDRLLCAHCGETSAHELETHAAESVPWVRVDECMTCRRYLKTVDLRQRGDAVPVVDEIATLELDVWAAGRGLTKVQVNVMEL
jgi:FdhE protein